jgi:hypothetical protein
VDRRLVEAGILGGADGPVDGLEGARPAALAPAAARLGDGRRRALELGDGDHHLAADGDGGAGREALVVGDADLGAVRDARDGDAVRPALRRRHAPERRGLRLRIDELAENAELAVAPDIRERRRLAVAVRGVVLPREALGRAALGAARQDGADRVRPRARARDGAKHRALERTGLDADPEGEE